MRYRLIRQFLRDPIGVMSATILLIMVSAVALAPVLSTLSPTAVDPWNMLNPPDVKHMFGTDDLGRDVFTRVLYAGRITLVVGFTAAAVAVCIGTMLGLIAGWYGGWIDVIVSWLTNAFLTVPLLAVALLVSAFMELNAWRLSALIGLLVWPGVSRIVRGQVLSLKEWPFVEASVAIGASAGRVLFLHLLPNLFGPVFVAGRLLVGFAVLVESALSFLGFGIAPPTPTWGKMLHEAQEYYRSAWWLAVYPGVAISLFVMSVNLGGDAVKDAMEQVRQR